MKLIDAHCHLQDDALFADIEGVIDRAVASGVERMVCNGTSAGDWGRVLQLSRRFSQVMPMLGIHPWFVTDSWESDFQTLKRLLLENPQAGIGETGLDSQDRFKNQSEQEASFAAHLDLACELDRPIAVHCVRSWGRLLDFLREHPAPRIQLHAFGGAVELIPELVDLNCWFSFCGSVSNPKAKRVRAAAVAVPENRLLIETDSPDFPPAENLAPNEPVHLLSVEKEVASLRNTSLESLNNITYRNAQKIFQLFG